MKNLLALYFSGTGNTKYAVKRFCNNFMAAGINCNYHSIEEDLDIQNLSESADTILIAYPIYGSMIPRIMRNFIDEHGKYFEGKNFITIVTQAMFSGDGGALAERQLKGINIHSIASVHIKMPSNLSFGDVIKIKNGDEIKNKINEANKKIDKISKMIIEGKKIKDGKAFYSRIFGAVTERNSFRVLEKKYAKSLIIHEDLCTKCGYCVKICPMKNLEFKNGLLIHMNNCTLCTRCVNSCPSRAISLMSNAPIKSQYKRIDN